MKMNELIITMKNIFEGIGTFFSAKLLSSIILPLIGVLFGFENDLILRSLLILIVFDFITGLISAKQTGEPISSRIAVRSAFKVAMYGLLASAGHLTETITPGTTFIEETIISFLALTELISIIENIGKMGYAIPKKLLNSLHKLRNEDTTISQKKTIRETVDPNTNIIKTHTVEEKQVETHITEKPSK